MQLRKRGCGARLDGVGQSEHACGASIHGDQHHRPRPGLQCVDLRRQFRELHFFPAQQRGIADADPLFTHPAPGAQARIGGEFRHLARLQSTGFRRIDDGARQRMFAGRFHRRREPQHLVLAEARDRRHRLQRRLAQSERAGLVDHQGIDLLQALQRCGIADQHAGLGAASDADHHRNGRGQAESAGTGDDQYRHRRQQRMRAGR